MKVLDAGIAVASLRAVRQIAWLFGRRPASRHDATEYYRSWGGYRHPISLQSRISKEEAEDRAAGGKAYLISSFDAQGRLVRVIKMLKGSIFFEFVYEYHPNGKLKTATITNAKGETSLRRYDERGRKALGDPNGFW